MGSLPENQLCHRTLSLSTQTLRIISGIAKGKKISTPARNDLRIRPTSDRAREALFSILGNKLHGLAVLDLFCGTGALGLEAFSRGAALVVFIDSHKQAINLTKKNILRCLRNAPCKTEMRVIQHDLAKTLPLDTLEEINPAGFSCIFADPPYEKGLSLSTLDFVNNSGLLHQNGLLIIEEKSGLILPDRLPHLQLRERRTYGEVGFHIYETN